MLFNTYPFASLNGCFLGIRSNAIGGSWSNTLYSFDCFGSLTLISNLKCANTYSNQVYLNDVATTTNNPMQLFGYNNNIFLATSNSNSTGAIYFRNQTLSPFTYNDFAIFKQDGSNINSSLTLNNGLVCTNIQVNPSTSSPNANYIGYSNMVFTSGITYLPGTGFYTNVLSISLPYKGTYDCDISFPYNFVTGPSTNNTLQYCISTSSSSADSGVSNYVSIFNTTASFPQATMTFTFRRIIYVSSATTVYFIANFWGGSGCVGNIINPTYLRYTRIA